jgi:hypothetical protein
MLSRLKINSKKKRKRKKRKRKKSNIGHHHGTHDDETLHGFMIKNESADLLRDTCNIGDTRVVERDCEVLCDELPAIVHAHKKKGATAPHQEQMRGMHRWIHIIIHTHMHVETDGKNCLTMLG